MGDNRHHSHDCRFYTKNYRRINIDPTDTSEFGKKVYTSWDPFTVNKSYIKGRARIIALPLSRLKLF